MRKQRRAGLGHCAPCILLSLSLPRASFTMNTLRKLSSSSKPKAPRHTVSISRSEGSLGLGLDDDNCVTSITPGSSAAATDVLVGDYVVGIGGKPIGSRKLVSVLAENAGSEIELEIERASAESQGSSTPRGGSTPRFGSSLFGGMSRRSTRSDSHDSGSNAASDEVSHQHRTGSFAQAGETVRALRLNLNRHLFTPLLTLARDSEPSPNPARTWPEPSPTITLPRWSHCGWPGRQMSRGGWRWMRRTPCPPLCRTRSRTGPASSWTMK